jgi:hypothetical protein
MIGPSAEIGQQTTRPSRLVLVDLRPYGRPLTPQHAARLLELPRAALDALRLRLQRGDIHFRREISQNHKETPDP